jgi:Zn-dependent peptidase ImmA (M78 family)
MKRKIARVLGVIRFRQPPTDLQAVARHLGVEAIRYTVLSMKGRLVLENGGDVVIEINNALPVLRQRHVLAHELGHLLLEPDRLTKSATLGHAIRIKQAWQFQKLEERCDEAACEILIPTDWLLAHQATSLGQAAKQANDAGVELELLVTRLIDLGVWEGERLWWVTGSSPYQLLKSYPPWDDDFLARVSFDPLTQDLIGAATRSSIPESGRISAVVQDEAVDYQAEAMKLVNGNVLVRLHGRAHQA